MNNRQERIDYINSFNSQSKDYLLENDIPPMEVEFNIVEEVFILQCVENQYAMNFVDNKIKDVDRFVPSDFYEKYNYKYLMLNGYHKIDKITDVIVFLEEAEDNLELLRSLCSKVNKEIYKNVINGQIKASDLSEVDCCMVLFMLSFLNDAITEGNHLEVFQDAQIILSSCISSRLLTSELSEKLRSDYKECLDCLNIEQGITLGDVIKINNKEYMEYMKNHRFPKSYDDVIRFTQAEARRRINLIEQDRHITKDEQILTVSRRLIHFGENSFKIYRRMMQHVISSEDIDYILFILDILLKRGVVVTSKEIELLNILMARIADWAMTDIIDICVEKSIKLNNSQMELKKEISARDDVNFRLTDENNQLRVRTLSLEDENIKIKRELEQAKAEISRLKSKKNKEFNDKKELESLRELFFNMEKDEVACDISDSRDLTYDKDKKIAFVGSNANLHSKLEPIFDKCKYIEAEEVTRELSFLKNLDIVFLHTHNSHTMYYKVLETIKASNTRLVFLNSVNVDILANEMIGYINK